MVEIKINECFYTNEFGRIKEMNILTLKVVSIIVHQWFIEGLYSIGRFFLHPFVYFFLIYSFVLGFIRVKRERKSFHIRVYDAFEEIRFTYSKGIAVGLFFSIISLAFGFYLSFGAIVLWTLVTFVFSLTFRPRLLSPVITVGTTILLIPIFIKWREGNHWIDTFFVDLEKINVPVFTLLFVLFIVLEGILVYRTGHLRTSPFIIKSQRGLPIGNHAAKRTWLVPFLLFVPGGELESPFTWWPVFSMNGESFLLLFLPLIVGFEQRIQGSLPKESIQTTGKRIIWLGILCLIPGFLSIWVPLFSFITVLIALIGHEFITVKQRMNDDSASYYFSKRDQGLIILGTLPNSPGEKMGLKVGEILLKANGKSVKSKLEFYEALQQNRAYCKLEVKGLNGEIRYVKGALYEGSHHELGILFVPDDKKWEKEAASIS
jgi:hypothetical protein